MEEVLYQYIVTYYADNNNLSIASRYMGPHVVWTNILTGKVERHDGPCVTNLFTGEKFYTPVKTYTTRYDFCNETLLVLDYHIKDYLVSYQTVTHQYIVSYFKNSYRRCSIEYRNILTDELEHHNGWFAIDFLRHSIEIWDIDNQDEFNIPNLEQLYKLTDITSNPFPGRLKYADYDPDVRKPECPASSQAG
jgi:hypothetical protein